MYILKRTRLTPKMTTANCHDNKRSINLLLSFSKELEHFEEELEVLLRLYFFSKCVKSSHQKQCCCTLLTHFEKNYQSAVSLS